MLKPLPVGIQTFKDIIEGGFLYVDKTLHIYELIRYPKGYFFLSRPRRFGKSVTISTLAAIFSGNRELFKGLWLYDSDYDWQSYPIIRIDFSRLQARTVDELEQNLKRFLQRLAKEQGITLGDHGLPGLFDELIYELSSRGKVVVLIDEYDKPIIDNINNVEEAIRMRDLLKSFYSVIKASDEYIRFALLTGISRFSRVGIFSGLNNLRDISLSDGFASIVGITQAELEDNFSDYLSDCAEQLALSVPELLVEIRHWYNGFRFSGTGESVYNPFSVLFFFSDKRFSNYWFESGTPSFLIKLIRAKEYDIEQVNQLQIGESAFSSYEIDNLQITPLLLQTGYLTIQSYDPETRLYTLNYPNYEVEDSFLTHLLGSFSRVETGSTTDYLWQLITALRANKLDEFFQILKVFFAQVDYTLQIKQEKYYQTIFYLIFKLIGLRIQAEVSTDKGRIDAVIELESAIYLFEFKLDGNAQIALEQIKQKEYFVRYLHQGKTIHLVGVNFDMHSHQVSEWLVESLESR